MEKQTTNKIDLGDRLVSAFLGAILAGVTLFLYPFVLVALFARASFGLFLLVFSKIGLFIVASAFVAGFILGPERLSVVLSFFWGTHPAWKKDIHSQKWWLIAVVTVFGLLVAYYFDQLMSLKYHR